MSKSIVNGFINSTIKYKSRIALEVDGQNYTYQQLANMAHRIANAIRQNENKEYHLAAFLAYPSPTAYSGVLGILLSGKGYVPLNPEFPSHRTHSMLTLSGVNVLIVGKECLDQLKMLLSEIEQTLTLIFPDVENADEIVKDYPGHRYIFSGDMPEQSGPMIEPEVDSAAVAYLLFTSGSTGVPKGVPVSHNNVISYVEYICDRYKVNEQDRFSQSFDMTFDLSVHDMFVSWQRGACLCSIPKRYVMTPAKFIKDNQLTMWFSVPSSAMFLSKLRMLSPDAFPTLRYSLFCGEPLPGVLAKQWQEAAPNSVVENLYGPTEATIAISYYTWEGNSSLEKCVNGVVPIGFIFEGQRGCVLDQQGRMIENEESGELCLSGSQVTQGYLNNPEKTKAQYIKISSSGDELWYRTGDLVKQDEKGCLSYLGRIDNQVKILGHRVELQEIDHALRKASKTELALSIAWPLNDGSASGVVGFIGGKNNLEESQVLQYCKELLPEYMVPKRLYFVDDMPLNSNGKLDRKKLREMLDKGVLV